MTNVHFSSNSNEWRTPEYIFKYAQDCIMLEEFKLDAAASADNTLCPVYFSDALDKDWYPYGNVWCNPPYGRLIGKFVEKAHTEALKGANVCLLIPARVDTRWWHDYCAKHVVFFIKGRLRFSGAKFNAPFPSALVLMNEYQLEQTHYVEVIW